MNTIMLRGHCISIDDDKPTFWAKAAAGDWEPETLDAMDGTVGPGTVFLDIGAWVGPTALYAAALGATVVAVEADPIAFAQFEANVALNRELRARITLIKAAVAPSAGTARLGAPRKLGDSMGSVLLAGKTKLGFDAQAITPTEIAALLPRRPLVLKMDIEGGEYGLVSALSPLLPDLETALVAFHPELLRELGNGETAIRQQTLRAFQAFAGFGGRPLGAPVEGKPEEIASFHNCTIRFDREAAV